MNSAAARTTQTDHELDVGFGELLCRLRKHRGMSQSDLAAKSGLTARTIVRLEQPYARPPRGSTSVAILEAFEARSPLTDDEKKHFLRLTGLMAIRTANQDGVNADLFAAAPALLAACRAIVEHENGLSGATCSVCEFAACREGCPVRMVREAVAKVTMMGVAR
ncbi:MAG: helix-turn-helix domain-containing protein [Phycisphaerales bacterium]